MGKTPEEEHPVKAFGWAARDASGVLSPFKFSRRENEEYDVTLKVLYCGICHSDLHFLKDEWGMSIYPLVPGHEIVGIVTKVGSKVQKVKVGEKAGVGCLIGSCHSCDDCANDRESYCTKQILTYSTTYYDGTTNYGGYSDIMVCNEHFVIRFPDNLPLDAGAPLLCAGITVYSPLKYFGLDKPGTHVGVVGLGGLGHMAVKFAKAFGVKWKPTMECPSQLHTSNFSTQFCIQVANQVLLKQIDKGSNFVLSPLSFHFMLSLIAAGSTGRTLEQLLSYLGSKSIGDLNFMSSQFVALTSMMSNVKGGKSQNNQISSPSLSFANGLWIDRRFSLNPSYERILKASYNAKAKEVDFANKADKVIDEVNSWVENETKGLIKDLLRPGSINGDTALLFANALYFKGKWDRKFNKKLTRNMKFHLLNGKTVRVPFMTNEKYEHHHLYGSFDGYKILSIPYQSSQFYMYFFLPDDTNGLPRLVKRLNSNPGFMNQEFELWEEEVPELWIPRFKFSFEFEASETIKEMGLELPFMDVGELTEMVVDGGEGDELGGGLYLSKVFHKSCIEVNEEGTEAAASTAGIIRSLSNTIPTPRFVADHPFMFMIREETSGTVLFTGAVLNPLLVA